MPTDATPRIRPGDRILRKPEAMRISAITSNTTWWRYVKNGRLPEPVTLGPQLRGWIDREIYAALNRMADGGEAA